MILEVLLSLSKLLAPGDDGSLQQALTLAVNEPAAYLRTHPETAERGFVEADTPSLPWLALVDGLLARGHAMEVDHRTDMEEVQWNLSKVKNYSRFSPKTRAWMESVSKMEGGGECLRALAPHAAADGLVIAVMDIDSDSYVTLILGRDDYAKATALAAKAGYILKDIREHDPND